MHIGKVPLSEKNFVGFLSVIWKILQYYGTARGNLQYLKLLTSDCLTVLVGNLPFAVRNAITEFMDLTV